METKIIAIANQKGGTAKTTTACNLAHALAIFGKKVLLIDLDPQGNLSMCLGIENPDEIEMPINTVLTHIMQGDDMPEKSLYVHRALDVNEDFYKRVMRYKDNSGQGNYDRGNHNANESNESDENDEFEKFTHKTDNETDNENESKDHSHSEYTGHTDYKNDAEYNGFVEIIPCNLKLSDTELALRDEMGGERVLSQLLDELHQDYDYIIIDTNPSIGLLTINALVACQYVIIPASPQLWSATGLTGLLGTIAKVKRKINPQINVMGILFTICDNRTNLDRESKNLVIESYGDSINVFDTCIPSTVKVGEANYFSKSILEYEPSSKAATAYVKLAEEVLCYENGK